MKTTLTRHCFIDRFMAIRPDNFTYHGLNALWSFFEEMEESTGEEMEFDPIAICVEFTEYADLDEIKDEYYDLNLESIEQLTEYTLVIQSKTSIIIANF